jgi:uncharacterized delta-60 repeat protein
MDVRRVTVAFALVVAIAAPAGALPGDLDLTFGGDGLVAIARPGEAQASAVAMQGTKIVVGGTQQRGEPSMVIARLRTGGALDPGFGTAGIVNVAASDEGDWLDDLLVMSDGRILAVGGADVNGRARFLLVRLLPDGRRDRTFGGDGIVTIGFAGGPASAESVTLMPDGSIVTGGGVGEYPTGALAIARSLPNGRIDRSFSGDGRTTISFPTRPYAFVDDLVAWRSPADHVLVVGTARVPGEEPEDVAIVSLEPDGKLDRDFGGGDGKALFDHAVADRAGSVVLQPMGYFVVVGASNPGGEWGAMLVRFNASGHIDHAWGTSGVAYHDVSPGFEHWAASTTAGRSIVVAGAFASAGGLIRVRANGTRDPDFGCGSVAVLYPGGTSGFSAVAIQDDGRIVAAGYTPDDSSIGFALARVLP